MMNFGGIVVCGGASTRMGTSKPWLPFGETTLLGRVVHTLAEVVEPIVVVGARDRPLPPLGPSVLVCHDREGGRGPLEGMAVGLATFGSSVGAAFVASGDAALLSTSMVRGLCDLLGDHDAVVPVVGGYRQPLWSVCRITVLPSIEAMITAGERQTHRLFDRLVTRFVDEDELRRIDPELTAGRPMNTPDEYLAALTTAGLAPPATPPGK
jgi:molybdopterin-guanine dinucleotide biosynthesis protein A